jgi:hypothetical protein
MARKRVLPIAILLREMNGLKGIMGAEYKKVVRAAKPI